MRAEGDWYRCGHCYGLFHAAGAAEPAGGACTHRRGPHQAADPGEPHELPASDAPDGVQDYWQECRHCRALFFAGPCEEGTSLGICPGRPVGEPHEPVDGGAVYHLPRSVDSTRTEWSRCRRCWSLVREDGHESTCAWPRFSHSLQGGRYRLSAPAAVVAPQQDAATPVAAGPAPHLAPATRVVAFRRQLGALEPFVYPYVLVDLSHPDLDGRPHALVNVTADVWFVHGELTPPAVVRAVLYLDETAELHGANAGAPRDRWYAWLDRAVEGMTLHVIAVVPG
jgi:hypothetical protein